ncbi:hypothetical protein CFP56_000337 [Quercus suber]|uniref:Uncharacterized protein n=1 Tax=Quercus suber TaxID=58331 RepID=A0AAW0M7U2_QUESU
MESKFTRGLDWSLSPNCKVMFCCLVVALELLQEFQDVHKKAHRVVDHSKDLWWKPPDYGL